MKTLVLGLESADADLLFGLDDLPFLRRLMEVGCYGRLDSVVPPASIPAWMCLATSQDPGSLGIYGSRSRVDHSYDGPRTASSTSVTGQTIWDHLAREGKSSILVGVPPAYPPRKIHGISVGCSLTPDTDEVAFTHPAELSQEIRRLVGRYPVDVNGPRTRVDDDLAEQILAMSRTQFRVVRHLMQTQPWDYFQFVDIGLDRLHHGFWRNHDLAHDEHGAGSLYLETVRNYYRHLDDEIGKVLELLRDETVVLVVSPHRPQCPDAALRLNEWLVREGLLRPVRDPSEAAPQGDRNIDWEKTKVWSEGATHAQLFFNVRGREPRGLIERADYENFRDEMKRRLETSTEAAGRPLGMRVSMPESIYREVRGVAPDLIVQFDAPRWGSIDGGINPCVRVQESHSESDRDDRSELGAFILAGPIRTLGGEVRGARLLDIAPTLLDLGGHEIPQSMQGRSLVELEAHESTVGGRPDPDEEQIVRDRLSGLGYI